VYTANPEELRNKVCLRISKIGKQARSQIRAFLKIELRRVTNDFFGSLSGSIDILSDDLARAEEQLHDVSFIYEDHIRLCLEMEKQLQSILHQVDQLLNCIPQQKSGEKETKAKGEEREKERF